MADSLDVAAERVIEAAAIIFCRASLTLTSILTSRGGRSGKASPRAVALWPREEEHSSSTCRSTARRPCSMARHLPRRRRQFRSAQFSMPRFGVGSFRQPDAVEGTRRVRRRRLQGLHVRQRHRGIPAHPRGDVARRHEARGRAWPARGRPRGEPVDDRGAGPSCHEKRGETGVADYLRSRPIAAELEAIGEAVGFARKTAARCMSSTSARGPGWSSSRARRNAVAM